MLPDLPATAYPSTQPSPAGPVGIFDSGVGGLSILQHVNALMPAQEVLYFADAGFAPYGEKPEQEIVDRALHIARFLLAQGAKSLVVACNTATVAAIAVLRQHYPQLPVVGVEPGLKPAAVCSQNKVIGVMATDRTLNGDKFIRLQQEIEASHQVKFLLQACTGLAYQIELGELTTPATQAMLERYITPLLQQGADTLVLGCTHYPFVRPQIEQLIARHATQAVTLIDTGAAVARQLQRLLLLQGLPQGQTQQAGAPLLRGYTNGEPAALQLAFAQLLNLNPPVVNVSGI
jgi:glutamate racemase